MTRRSESLPPLQFGIRTLLVATAVGAVLSSAASVLGWSWELVGLVAPLVCFVAYQSSYALIARLLNRHAWDGAHHGCAVAFSLAVVVGAVWIALIVAAIVQG